MCWPGDRRHWRCLRAGSTAGQDAGDRLVQRRPCWSNGSRTMGSRRFFSSLRIVSLWLYCLSKTLPIFIIGVVIVLTKTCVMFVRMKPSIWLLTLKPYLLLPNSVTWGKLRCLGRSHPQGVGNSTWLATLLRGLYNVFKTPSSVWAPSNGLLERPSVGGALFS